MPVPGVNDQLKAMNPCQRYENVSGNSYAVTFFFRRPLPKAHHNRPVTKRNKEIWVLRAACYNGQRDSAATRAVQHSQGLSRHLDRYVSTYFMSPSFKRTE